jgi:hypothetical protein
MLCDGRPDLTVDEDGLWRLMSFGRVDFWKLADASFSLAKLDILPSRTLLTPMPLDGLGHGRLP